MLCATAFATVLQFTLVATFAGCESWQIAADCDDTTRRSRLLTEHEETREEKEAREAKEEMEAERKESERQRDEDYAYEQEKKRKERESKSILTPVLVVTAIILLAACCCVWRLLRRNIDHMVEGTKLSNAAHDEETQREIELQKQWTEQQFAPALSNRADTPGIWTSLKKAAQKHRVKKAKVTAEDRAAPDPETGIVDAQTNWAYNVGVKHKNGPPDAKAAPDRKPTMEENGIWGSFKRTKRKLSGAFHGKRSRQVRSGQAPSTEDSSSINKPPKAHSEPDVLRTKSSSTQGSELPPRAKSDPQTASSAVKPNVTPLSQIRSQLLEQGPSSNKSNKSVWESFKEFKRSRVRKLTGKLAEKAAAVRGRSRRHQKDQVKDSNSEEATTTPTAKSFEKQPSDGQANDGPRHAASAQCTDTPIAMTAAQSAVTTPTSKGNASPPGTETRRASKDNARRNSRGSNSSQSTREPEPRHASSASLASSQHEEQRESKSNGRRNSRGSIDQ